MLINVRDIEDLAEAVARRLVPLVKEEIEDLVRKQLKEVALQLELFADRIKDK